MRKINLFNDNYIFEKEGVTEKVPLPHTWNAADRLYPWDGEKEKLMLFNENVVDLNKFMTMKKSDSFEDILA